jgi:hypothetical protein
MKSLWTLLAFIALLPGCAHRQESLYTWGHYEDQIYSFHAEPGKMPPEMRVEQLEQDYQKARAANKRMHPGFHAQLGYLYVQLGKRDQARQEFATEKAEFPESAVLMDRLVANLGKK